MPELPEVEITARLMTAALAGATVDSARAPGLATMQTFRPALDALAGATLERVDRRGKLLLLRFAGGGLVDGDHPEGRATLVIHLMSAGRLQLFDKRATMKDRTARIVVRLTGGADGHEGERELRLKEFGTRQSAWGRLLRDEDVEADDTIATLGPEAWPDPPVFAQRVPGAATSSDAPSTRDVPGGARTTQRVPGAATSSDAPSTRDAPGGARTTQRVPGAATSSDAPSIRDAPGGARTTQRVPGAATSSDALPIRDAPGGARTTQRVPGAATSSDAPPTRDAPGGARTTQRVPGAATSSDAPPTRDAPGGARTISLPPRRPLRGALRDQRVIAGIGRRWADEILWEAKLAPLRRCGDLDEDELARLRAAIVVRLDGGVNRYAADLRLPLKDKFPVPEQVHGRAGEPCPRCGTTILAVHYESDEMAYCPHCQTADKPYKDRRFSRLLKE